MSIEEIDALEGLTSGMLVTIHADKVNKGKQTENVPLLRWLEMTSDSDISCEVIKARKARQGNVDKTTVTGCYTEETYCTPSVATNGGIYEYNGVVVIQVSGLSDIMAEAIKQMLVTRPYIFYSAISSRKDEESKRVVAYAMTDNKDSARHALYWEAIASDIEEVTHRKADQETKEPTAIQPLAFDFNPAINLAATPFASPEPHIPVHLLPPFFREVLEETVTQYQCPPEFAFAFMYGAICTLTGLKYACDDRGFENYCSTWICIVAPSGGTKSPTMKYIFSPIYEEESRRYDNYRAALEEWEAGDKSTPRPVWHQVYAKEITPEARNRLLYQNGGQLTMLVPEVVGMVEKWGRYNSNTELTDFLELRSHEAGPVNRLTSESYFLKDVCFSVVGGTQPATLKKVFGKPELRGTGFVPRWLWVWPEKTPKRHAQRRRPDKRIKQKWADFLKYLYDLEGVKELVFHDTASDIYDQYYNDVEDRMAQLEEDNPFRECLAKFEIWVIELAIGFQVMMDYQSKIDNDLPDCGVLSPEAMTFAVNCCRDYFEFTAAKVLQKTAPPPATSFSSKGVLNKGDAIRNLAAMFPGLNRSKLAEAIGTTQPYITNTLNRRK